MKSTIEGYDNINIDVKTFTGLAVDYDGDVWFFGESEYPMVVYSDRPSVIGATDHIDNLRSGNFKAFTGKITLEND